MIIKSFLDYTQPCKTTILRLDQDDTGIFICDSRKGVPKRGLEPPPGCPDMNLNHARLPIPPLRLTLTL